MSVSVCLSLSVFVRDYIFRTTRPIFADFLCVLPTAVARSFSGGVAIRYVLPVLWMRSYLLNPRLLDIAAQVKRNAHAALGLAINCAQ